MLTYPIANRNELIPSFIQSLPATAEKDNVQSEGMDSDHFSGSNSSFLANEHLMSVDSINSDITGMTRLLSLDF